MLRVALNLFQDVQHGHDRVECWDQHAATLLTQILAKHEDKDGGESGTNKREETELKALAFAIVQRIPEDGLDSKRWMELAECIVAELRDGEIPDVLMSALLGFVKLPVYIGVEFLSRPGFEEVFKRNIQFYRNASVRQTAVSLLGSYLLRLWRSLKHGTLILSKAFMDDQAGQDVCQIVQDRIVDVMRMIANAVTDDCHYVAGTAFQRVEEVLEIRSQYGPSSLTERVIDLLLTKLNFLCFRAYHMCELGEEQGVPSSHVFSHQVAAINQTSSTGSGNNVGNVTPPSPSYTESPSLLMSPGFSSSTTPSGSQSSTGGFQDFTLIDEDLDEQMYANSIECASVAVDFLFGISAMSVVTKLILHVTSSEFSNIHRELGKRHLTAEFMSTMPSDVVIAVESVPGDPDQGYTQVVALQAALSWLDGALHEAIMSKRSIPSSIAAAKNALSLVFGSEDIGHMKGKSVCQTVADALVKHRLSYESTDSAKLEFNLHAIEIYVQSVCQPKKFNLSPIWCGYHLSHALIRCASCSYLINSTMGKDDLGKESPFVELLYRIWDHLFGLDIPSQDLWTILFAEDPGVLQEILKNHYDSREIRYALCFTLLESLANQGKEIQIDRALYCLELTNSCLTWEHVSFKFNVVSSYINLTKTVLNMISQEPEETIKRAGELLNRLIQDNLGYWDNFRAEDKTKLLYVLAKHSRFCKSKDQRLLLLDSIHGEISFRLQTSKMSHDAGPLFTLLDSMVNVARQLEEETVVALKLLDDMISSNESGITILQTQLRAARQAITDNQDEDDELSLFLAPFDQGHRQPQKHAAIAGKRSGVPNHFQPIATKTLSGLMDPISVTATAFVDSGILHITCIVENRARNPIKNGVVVQFSCVGSLAKCSDARDQFVVGKLVVQDERISVSSSFRILGIREENQDGFGNPMLESRKNSSSIDEDEEIAAAVVSSIAFARKQGSGRSIKAVISRATESATSRETTSFRKRASRSRYNNTSGSESGYRSPSRRDRAFESNKASRPSTPGKKRKKRNSLLSGTRSLLPTLVGGLSSNVFATTEEETTDPESQSFEREEFENFVCRNYDTDELGILDFRVQSDGIDVGEKSILISVQIMGQERNNAVGTLAFPKWKLPMQLFLRPMVDRNESKMLELDKFRPIWGELPYPYFAHTKQAFPGADLENAMVFITDRLRSITHVNVLGQASNNTRHLAFLGKTWSGRVLGFVVTLQIDEHQGDVNGVWEVRTNGPGIHEAWVKHNAFPSMFESLFGEELTLMKHGVNNKII